MRTRNVGANRPIDEFNKLRTNDLVGLGVRVRIHLAALHLIFSPQHVGRWVCQQVVEIENAQIRMTAQEGSRLKPLRQQSGPAGLSGTGLLWVEGRSRKQYEKVIRVLVHGVSHTQIQSLVPFQHLVALERVVREAGLEDHDRVLEQATESVVGRVVDRLREEDCQTIWIRVASTIHPGNGLGDGVVGVGARAIWSREAILVVVVIPELVALLREQLADVSIEDMEGRFPEVPPDYPVLWISTVKDAKAPFGETVFMAGLE